MNKTSRRVVRLYLIAGVLFILFGFAQFVVSLGLDELGVIEVGNALGLAFLLYIAVAIGFLVLLLGLLLRLLLKGDTKSRPRVVGSPFNRERESK